MHFLNTAGGSREYIDPVRFISNASTGKMGYALARAASKTGHKVTLISAAGNLRSPSGAKVVKVETSTEMFEAVKKYFGRCDCLIMAAAVSDYTPVRPSKTKIKKSGADLAIRLKPTTDILKWASKHKKSRIVAGFALEDKAIRPRAEKKLKEKNLDMIIANTTAAIGAETSAVQIKCKDSKWIKFPMAAKSTVAGRIIRLLAKN